MERREVFTGARAGAAAWAKPEPGSGKRELGAGQSVPGSPSPVPAAPPPGPPPSPHAFSPPAPPGPDRLRIIKSPEAVALIRQAIDITEGAIAATFAKLAAGASEREVAQLLSAEMRQRGAEGGGLVQFGPSSALPHGGPGGPTLAREMVVLIDCGCRVAGYTSDITRTTWFGDSPVPEFTQVFNLRHDAQKAARQQPPLTPCQEMDRVARRVIAQGGFGPFFTHRLGHGMGLDGHEPPYLVEGNATPLEPGMVFTIEPGICT